MNDRFIWDIPCIWGNKVYGYKQDLDLQVISHCWCVSYPMRCGCERKVIWNIYIYLYLSNYLYTHTLCVIRLPMYPCKLPWIITILYKLTIVFVHMYSNHDRNKHLLQFATIISGEYFKIMWVVDIIMRGNLIAHFNILYMISTSL